MTSAHHLPSYYLPVDDGMRLKGMSIARPIPAIGLMGRWHQPASLWPLVYCHVKLRPTFHSNLQFIRSLALSSALTNHVYHRHDPLRHFFCSTSQDASAGECLWRSSERNCRRTSSKRKRRVRRRTSSERECRVRRRTSSITLQLKKLGKY